FFFQAEDGIRYRNVTGVQTCALPISDSNIVQFFLMMNDIPYISTLIFVLFGALLTIIIQSSSATLALTMTLMAGGMIPFEIGARSEERRVGKESRTRANL